MTTHKATVMQTSATIRSFFYLVAFLLLGNLCVAAPSLAADDFWIRKGSGAALRPFTKPAEGKAKKRTELRTKLKSRKFDADESSSETGLDSAPETTPKATVPNTTPPTVPTQTPTNDVASLTGSADAEPVETADDSDLAPFAGTPDQSGRLVSPATEIAQPYTPTYSNPVKRKWRVGVFIRSGSKPIADVLAQIPIPQHWPEQRVSVFENSVPANFEVEEIEQLDGLQRLLLHGREIPARKTVLAVMTYVVTTQSVDAPADTTIFRLPDPDDREVKGFLKTSAGINFRNKKLKKQAAELVARASTDWDKALAIYNWVRANITQIPEIENAKYLGSQAAFVKRKGYNEDVVAVFVAMCRSVDIPARMVFVDGGTDAEFMLDDPAGRHHWFPCDLVGLAAFGKTVEPKIILQKGDSIKVPGQKGRQKFVVATGVCKGIKGTRVEPLMQFIREPRPFNE